MASLKTTVARLLALVVCVSSVIVAASAQTRSSAAPGAPAAAGAPGTASAAVLTAIPDDYQEPPAGWAPLCSADEATCLYHARKGAEAFVVVNGKPGTSYDEVRDTVMSREGHVAYEARRQNAWMVVTDGVEGPAFDDIEHLKIAGSTSAYVGVKGRQRRLVHGTKQGDPDSALVDFTLSPDGKSTAYAVTREQTMVFLSGLMLNGEYLWEDNLISNVTFTNDGQHLAYASRTGTVLKGRSKLMLDEEALSEHSEILTAIAVSADGKKIAPVACTGAATFRKCALLLNGKPVRETSLIEIPVFSPDGTTLAWAERASATSRWRVVVGDKPGPEVETVLDPVTFSPNSRRHGYPVRTTGVIAAAVIDGVVGPTFDDVVDVAFSADSAHVSYVAIKGNTRRVVLDSLQGPAFAWVSVPRFDADGKSVTYVAQDGRRFLRQRLAAGTPAPRATRPQ